MAKGTKIRKPRNKMSKSVNLLYPIALDKFGSKDDPCFGKLNDPKASECQRCGDCEICAIVQMSSTVKLREKVEGKQPFKDLEEKELYEKMEKGRKVPIEKRIKPEIREYLRTNKKTTYEELSEYIGNKFGSKYNVARIKKIILKMETNSSHITTNRKTITWK